MVIGYYLGADGGDDQCGFVKLRGKRHALSVPHAVSSNRHSGTPALILALLPCQSHYPLVLPLYSLTHTHVRTQEILLQQGHDKGALALRLCGGDATQAAGDFAVLCAVNVIFITPPIHHQRRRACLASTTTITGYIR